ncbi:hypothetical protein F4823DRAFT_608493 [Ustulina deusta]|nr:hypothetical protein F4823DRAFT_608493 [Ustulina deusta]
MYDHTLWKARDPVRSPLDKPERAKSVVGSVTTGESLVLYIYFFENSFSFFPSIQGSDFYSCLLEAKDGPPWLAFPASSRHHKQVCIYIANQLSPSRLNVRFQFNGRIIEAKSEDILKPGPGSKNRFRNHQRA